MMTRPTALLAAFTLTAGLAYAQPATRPAAGTPPMVQRLIERVETLDLTAEQKEQFKQLREQIAQTVQGMAKELKDLPPVERRERLREALDLREKVKAILTPEQMRKLAEQMPALREGAAGGKRENRRQNRQDKKTDATQPSTRPTAKAPAVGDAAPAFSLRRLGSGNEVTHRSFAGKPLVLAFGSLSSPAFRDRIAGLEMLRNQYRNRASVLVVYTREEHPADGWQVERNKDDKIEVNQPTTYDERLALANQLRERTKTTLDIAVDDPTDAVAVAYGSRPQGAAVISRYGKIIGTQTFCDPSGLGRMIDEALASKG